MYFFFYYPLGVSREQDGRPWVSWVIIAFMCALFAYFQIRPDVALSSWEWWVYFPQGGIRPGLFLSIFNHGGWMHLLGNLIYFWTFAPSLELALGKFRFALLFCALGVFSNLIQGLNSEFLPWGQAGLGVIGASGAISGLMTLFLLRFPYAKIRTAWILFSPLHGLAKSGIIHISSILAIFTWVIFQLIQVFTEFVNGCAGSTAYGAHFGGLLLGLLFGFGMQLHLDGKQFMYRHRVSLRFSKGDLMGAYEASQAMIDSDNPEDLSLAAQVARLIGHHDEAQDLYKRAVDSALDMDDHAGAAASYSEALRFFPNMYFGEQEMNKLILALDRLGMEKPLLKAFRIFQIVYPHSEYLLSLMLRVARIEEPLDPDRARQLYEQHLDLFPVSPYVNLIHTALRQLEGA